MAALTRKNDAPPAPGTSWPASYPPNEGMPYYHAGTADLEDTTL